MESLLVSLLMAIFIIAGVTLVAVAEETTTATAVISTPAFTTLEYNNTTPSSSSNETAAGLNSTVETNGTRRAEKIQGRFLGGNGGLLAGGFGAG
jgi:hypothetical protein